MSLTRDDDSPELKAFLSNPRSTEDRLLLLEGDSSRLASQMQDLRGRVDRLTPAEANGGLSSHAESIVWAIAGGLAVAVVSAVFKEAMDELAAARRRAHQAPPELVPVPAQ